MKHAHRNVTGLLVLLASLLASLPVQAADAKPDPKKAVNINSADSSQLAMLPRVGPSVADRIVDYRKQNGPFKKAEDLMLVQGIGDKTFQLLKPYVATSGETTLREKVHGSRSSSSSKSDKSDKPGGKSGDKPGKSRSRSAAKPDKPESSR
jgi:competence ComEA-like helix-hairpin-helix protein